MEAKIVDGEPLYFSADMLTDWTPGDTDEIYAFKVVRAVRYEALKARCRELEAAKDGAYEERNQCVALIARMVIEAGGLACKTKTAIEGWSEDWHGCVYIQLPTGQVSWHYHTSHEWMFEDLPSIAESWDGHDTPEKYRRVNAAFAAETPGKLDVCGPQTRCKRYPNCGCELSDEVEHGN